MIIQLSTTLQKQKKNMAIVWWLILIKQSEKHVNAIIVCCVQAVSLTGNYPEANRILKYLNLLTSLNVLRV